MGSAHDTALLRALLDYSMELPTEYDQSAALQRLAATAAEIAPGCGCGIIVEGADGDLRSAAGSDPRTERLEALQIELGEGPCLLAFELGEPIWSPDLRTDERFPGFGAAAAAAGMAAVLSMPMALDGRTIGAYNLFNDTPREFDEDIVLATRVLAALATSYLFAARGMERQQRLSEQLQNALDSRVIIEQAKGRLSGEMSITVDEAFELLRAHSRSRSTKMAVIAGDLLAGRLPIRDLFPELTAEDSGLESSHSNG